MEPDTSRSQQVVEDYKKRKLAVSALRRIQEIVHGFEHDRHVDRRLAGIGIALIVVLVAATAYFFLGTSTVTIR